MNLPDFKYSSQFNSLREQMRAPYIEFESETLRETDLYEKIRKELEGRGGKELPPEEVGIAPDGTFEYLNRKVLVYIRDQSFFPGKDDPEFKFHLCECSKLVQMRKAGRFHKYVVTTNTSGIFVINRINYFTKKIVDKHIEKRLNVCKLCLSKLDYKGYRKNKAVIYRDFDLEEYFNIYKKNLIEELPVHTPETAPFGIYPRDFDEISRQFREMKNWTCEKCKIDLSNHREFLHTHHKNGNKSDNSTSNLKCLCIRCHAEEFQHEHMKRTEDYRRFMRAFGKR